MPYGLVYYPRFEIDGLDDFRRRYDPTFDLIEPHLGIMFLVPDSVGPAALVGHLQRILKAWQPFAVRFGGVTKSWDHWLFLTLREGQEHVRRLYDVIYSGPIADYRYFKNETDFVPHVALGFFAADRDRYDHQHPAALELDECQYRKALAEAEALEIDVRRVVKTLHLIEFNDELAQIKSTQELFLG